jgi:hypothetical protein
MDIVTTDERELCEK